MKFPVGDDVATLVQLHLSIQKLGVRHVADVDEYPIGFEKRLLTGFDVPDAGLRHALVPQNLCDHRIPNPLDLLVLEGSFLGNLLGPQAVATMHQIDLTGVLGQEHGLLDGRIASADNDHRTVLVKEAVTGSAIRDAPAGELFLARHTQLAGRGSRGNDHSLGFILLSVGFDFEGMQGEIHSGDLVHLHPSAETLSLSLHQLGQFLSVYGFRETRVILYLIGKGHLAPQGAAGDE